MKPVLLFDTDGTLLKVRRPFPEQIPEEIFDKFSLDKKSVQKQSFAGGRTDRGIFREIFKSLQFEKIKTRYPELIENKVAPSEIQIMEGAEKLIEFAAGRGYTENELEQYNPDLIVSNLLEMQAKNSLPEFSENKCDLWSAKKFLFIKKWFH